MTRSWPQAGASREKRGVSQLAGASSVDDVPGPSDDDCQAFGAGRPCSGDGCECNDDGRG